ncbi:sigma-70 family RNA polymerase sigma factor [Sporichthya sp.]|uniref:RNA polymerase sigma factor n=1 Tax=Sporichthya sp. TaxID=65475 RepID=UPI0017E35E0C|nr:sigma-70 family RNA polymerase sigma factor [Sporichthya sp.]MBA3742876.1 sigma-70 family RNA polymerase sigma factor [Sporichthya sp.]
MKQPFEQIVAAHGPAVLRVCRAMLGVQDAEDAWSETFVAALRAYPELAADANVEAWLVTIAHRKAIDVGRANTRRPMAVAEPPEPPPVAVDDDQVWAAVRDLPDRQREAVAYHWFAGLPYAEIAVITGGNADAVRRAAADGLKTLRRVYGATPTTKGARS